MSGPNKRSDAYSNIFARPLPSTHQNPNQSPAPSSGYGHAPDRHSPQAYSGAYYAPAFPPAGAHPGQAGGARVVSGQSTHAGEPGGGHPAQRYYPDAHQGYRQPHPPQNYAQELTYGAPQLEPDPRQHQDHGYAPYQQQQRSYQSSVASDRSPALSSHPSFVSNDSFASTSASGPSSSSYYPYPPASSIPASLTPAYANGSALDNSPSNSPRSPIVPLPKQPPRLPEMIPSTDDFLGFESSRRDSDSYSIGARSRTTSNNVPPPQFYDGGPIGEEVDGFDQYGPSNGYPYYDRPRYSSTSMASSVDQQLSRRDSDDSDRNSLYRGSVNDQRPLLALNPSILSMSTTSLASSMYNTSPTTPLLSNRRSSESMRVMPTQPRSNELPQDRAFSFSAASVRPNMQSDQFYSRPPSIVSVAPPAAAPPRRAPVVYPALLSKVAEAFKSRITVSERSKDGLVYSETFDGRDAVDKIAYIIKTTDRNLALLLGRALDAQKFFHDVTYDHRLRDSPVELYQFKERIASSFVSADGVSQGNGFAMDGSGMANQMGEMSLEAADDSAPSGVFTLLTDCYSSTCTRDKLCYSIACPRRLEQQARLNLKPKPGLQRTISSESLADIPEPGSLWIHSVPQEVADSVSENEQKRQEVYNEVFYTERDFVRDMEYLRDSWIKPLRSSDVIPEARREDFITQVFWNVLEVYAVNVRLAELLNKRQKAAHVVEKIGDIFLEMVPHFGPFVKYGAHQLYGKYEFEKEKGSNPAFAKFVEDTERHPDSRKLELNGYLTKPTTRLARYPLLLESCLKNTPDDNPDKLMLPKVVKLVREFLTKVNIETGRSENRFNLAQLDTQLVFKAGETVDLRLRDEERELIYKGPLMKRGGTQSESAELQVFLFDHAILMVKQKSKNEQQKVYRKPIPLELLVVTPIDEVTSARTGAVRPKSLLSRGTNNRYLSNPPPGIDKNSKQGFAMTFIHLGRRGYQITLWSASWAGRKKWLEKIEGRQNELRERSLVFDTLPLSEGYFVGTNRVTCAAPFDNGNRMVFGTDNGVYLADLRERNKVPVKVISCPNVTQLDVLEEQGILIVLADKAVQTFFVDNLDPADAVGAAKRARKISSHATFFKAGHCLGRTLVCVVKSGSVSSTIKTLEPIDQVRGKKQPAIRKFLQGSNESLRVFKEFYIPTESSSVHFLKSKLCVGCTKGFEIVDLETLDTQGLLDPADSSLDFIQKRENARPIAIYRVEGDFLLCYDEFAFYVNKNGWRARSNWIIQWEGFPTHFALHYPYVLAFEPTFVEVRHVDSGALMQIIPGNNLRCLFADSPPSNATTSAYFPPPTSYGYQQQQQQQPNRGRHPGSSARSEIILVDGSRVCSLRFSPPPPPPR